MRRRALVSQTRVPEIDRDRGSQRVDLFVRWLLEQGWSVTFAAAETDGDERQAHRLRQLGVPTFAGMDEAAAAIDAGEFELAVLAFWNPASRLIPLLRERSPRTRVIVDSIDLHFLRDARRMLGAAGLDERFGGLMVGELNTYRAADAVLTVSTKEAALLGDFLGPGRIFDLPLAEPLERSELPFSERQGMVFVGNFRHLPNGEAVEFLCRDVLPRLDPELLAAHPLSVVGSRLDEKVRAHGRGMPSVRMVGWVPSVVPYLERARVCAVPMLHGAGVKGKIVESLILGTPVVTTTLGAEGMDLRHREHAVIADSPADLAAGLAHLLTDGAEWRRLADAGREHAAATHDPDRVRDRFLEIVDEVLTLPAREGTMGDGVTRARSRELAYRETVEATTETLAAIAEPGSEVLVVSRGDDGLVALDGSVGSHFPQTPDGRWAGYHPADSETAIRHLEALRVRGARYLAFPSTSFWWLHHYRELTEYLESSYRRIHSGEHLVVFDLGEGPGVTAAGADPGAERARVLVLGTYGDEMAAPPPGIVSELDRSERFEVIQRWRPAGPADDRPGVPDSGLAQGEEGADWVVHVSDDAVLPSGFLDAFLAMAADLEALGIERAQPAHAGGPGAGPPVTEQLRGVLGREVEQVTPLPVLAVRTGAQPGGRTAIIDAAPIGLARPALVAGDPITYSNVLDAFVRGDDGPVRAVQRSQGPPGPRISVLIATYDRPDLLAECLDGFCEQTLPVSDFEVVVVDDGSPGPETATVLERFAERLPLRWARIDHAGRSAAKNLAVLLARGELVLFMDDDDLPARELLAEHVRAHEQHPGEATAILGHTDWAPGLEVTPLMHYLTEVDGMLFSYGNLEEGQRLDWRGFWEGRISSKRLLHLRHGLHDQRLEYSIDVEMGLRLEPQGLEVVYHPGARSFMARPIDFDQFAGRFEAKGRAQAAIARLHDGDDAVLRYAQIEGAGDRWERARPTLDALVARIRELEREVAEAAKPGGHGAALEELHLAYRTAFRAFNAKGLTEGLDERRAAPKPAGRARMEVPSGNGTPASGRTGSGSETPGLTVTMPVWSRTPELAEMAAETIERVWDVARLRTEVVVVDNGSPEQVPLRARVHRFDENHGVATGWNTGIGLAQAPVVAVLNSDCLVEPGWDEALYEAATTGRRIAFPYTDHCDGRGFRRPDQAGTAGWCFVLTLDTYREVGPFDELFNPAYCEDTDYWHRAWELGIELAPVPDARVTHARRTSAGDAGQADWLLTAHRYLYGWKHGVEPMRAPPYYNREIVEYRRAQSPVSGAPTT